MIYTNSENHYYQEHVTNTTTTVVTSYTYDLYTDQLCTESFSYDSNSLYIVGRIVDGVWTKNLIQSVSDMPSNEASSLSNATVGRILLSNGKIWYVINAGISYFTTQWSGVCKVCSSNQATVVTVYDSSNNAYNAFKFTASGTDYYYVLDGTQTDWTDDLSSIGYHFTISYLNINKSRMTVGVGESYPLYNASGAQIGYDSTKTYTAVKYYTGSGDLVGTSALGITIGYISGWGYLMLTNNTGSAIQIQRIEYTVS